LNTSNADQIETITLRFITKISEKVEYQKMFLVFKNNINCVGYQGNFDIIKLYSDLGTRYDLESIMHYPENAFQKDKNINTIVSRSNKPFKPSERLTEIDIEEIQALYNCFRTSLN
jgi:hypothetical protein